MTERTTRSTSPDPESPRGKAIHPRARRPRRCREPHRIGCPKDAGERTTPCTASTEREHRQPALETHRAGTGCHTARTGRSRCRLSSLGLPHAVWFRFGKRTHSKSRPRHFVCFSVSLRFGSDWGRLEREPRMPTARRGHPPMRDRPSSQCTETVLMLLYSQRSRPRPGSESAGGRAEPGTPLLPQLIFPVPSPRSKRSATPRRLAGYRAIRLRGHPAAQAAADVARRYAALGVPIGGLADSLPCWPGGNGS